MNQEFEILLRSSAGYDSAEKAMFLMKSHGVWPTPVNYELWLHIAAYPECDLAKEVYRLVETGESMTESVTETLATRYISRSKINDEVRDTGLKLTQELSQITKLIHNAQTASQDYNQTLVGAQEELGKESVDISVLVSHLTKATSEILQHHDDLEKKMADSANEVKSLRRHLDQVRLEAMTDGLTNLANRKCFDENLNRHFDENDASYPLSVAVIDIDHFKKFNDTWGHQTGDQVLRYVSSVLARVGRAPRLAARYGGEEFAILFPGEEAVQMAPLLNEIRSEISSRLLKRRSTNEELGSVTISVGVAQREDNEDINDLIERADQALYQSKRNGRNQVTLAPELTKKAA
jgi:diguanylate cyclase